MNTHTALCIYPPTAHVPMYSTEACTILEEEEEEEYGNSVWSPYKVTYKYALESVQGKATRMLPGI